MPICVIGKYPPIQGGVSARTYQLAHGLARRGNDVHVVTNAAEVELPWRIFMQEADWELCEADYESESGGGRVRVSWTDPVDWRQRYIPRNNPSVTKLTSLVLEAHRERPFDLIHSYYLEPYGVAGHMAASLLGLPHAVKTAGSDAGKLWRQPQFEPLYDEILRSAELFLAGGKVAERAVAHGVDPERVIANRGFQLSTRQFCPEGPALDLPQLLADVERQADDADLVWGGFRGDIPFIGIYGKLGEKKGSFALLDALARARRDGARIGLVAMAHGHPDTEARFRSRAIENGLEEYVLQIPFLPHWRVPEFIRACAAVCCLEQDFPIAIHNPIVAQEVMSCGGCLVVSTELLAKQSRGHRLVDGVNCVAVPDSFDTEALAEALVRIAGDAVACTEIGRRARQHVERFYADDMHLDRTVDLLERARRRDPSGRGTGNDAGGPDTALSLTRLALDGLSPDERAFYADLPGVEPESPEWVFQVAARMSDAGAGALPQTVRAAVLIDARIRSALAGEIADDGGDGSFFRLGAGRMVRRAGDLAGLCLLLHPEAQPLDFDFDVLPFLRAQETGALPERLTPGESYLVVRPGDEGEGRVACVPPSLARLLDRLDGETPLGEIVDAVELDAFFDQIVGLVLDEFLVVPA